MKVTAGHASFNVVRKAIAVEYLLLWLWCHPCITYKKIMYLLTEWEGRTGKYLARGQDVRTERRPDFGATILRSISILSYDHLVLKILKILFEPNYDAIT